MILFIMRSNCIEVKYLLKFLPVIVLISHYQASGTDKYNELTQEMNNSYDSKEFLDEINNEIMKVIKDENFSVDSDEIDNEQHKEFEYLLQHKFWTVSENNNIKENGKEKEQCNSAQNLKIYKNLSISKTSNYNYVLKNNTFLQPNNIYFFFPNNIYFPVLNMNNGIFPGFPNINTINANDKQQINNKEERQKNESKNIETKKDDKYITECVQKKEKSNLAKLFDEIEIEEKARKGKKNIKKINNQKKYKNNTKKVYDSYYGYQNINKNNFNNITEYNYNIGHQTNKKWNNKKFTNKEYKTNNMYYGKYQYNKTTNNIQYKIKEQKQEDRKIKIENTQSNNILGQKLTKNKNYTKNNKKRWIPIKLDIKYG